MPDWRFLPSPMIDLTDPSAAFLASVTVTDPREVLILLARAPADTIEVKLRARRAETQFDGVYSRCPASPHPSWHWP